MVSFGRLLPLENPSPLANKAIIQKHIVMRGDVLLCEGEETRAFCIRHPDNPDRIKAIAVPEDIKALCS